MSKNVIEKLNEIILYKIDRNKNKIKLFGKHFIENNKDICYIIIEGEKYELKEYLFLKDIKKKETYIEIN